MTAQNMASKNVKIQLIFRLTVWFFCQQLRTELIEQIDGQLNDLIDDVLHDLDSLEPRRDHTYSRWVRLN